MKKSHMNKSIKMNNEKQIQSIKIIIKLNESKSSTKLKLFAWVLAN